MKPVCSAKADSTFPHFVFPACRRCAAGAWFIPLTVTITEFLNCLRRALSYMMRGWPEGRPYIGAQPTNL